MAPGGLRKPRVAHKGPKDSQKAQEAPGSEHIWYFRRDFIALLVKRDVLTAVLCAKVHFDSSFAYTIFDKCYESPIKITRITPKAPEGSKNGLDQESAIKPQSKCQSRAYFAHVFEPQAFFPNSFRKNDFETRPCAKSTISRAHLVLSHGFCSTFSKCYKTAARMPK